MFLICILYIYIFRKCRTAKDLYVEYFLYSKERPHLPYVVRVPLSQMIIKISGEQLHNAAVGWAVVQLPALRTCGRMIKISIPKLDVVRIY